jgi:NAD(P)H-dependent flavin oxidoreductase YrpB (nitropropane dioxygenase family)
LRNRLIDEMDNEESLDFPTQASLIGPLFQGPARAAFLPFWAGQSAALTRGLPAAELIDTLVAESQERLPRM